MLTKMTVAMTDNVFQVTANACPEEFLKDHRLFRPKMVAAERIWIGFGEGGKPWTVQKSTNGDYLSKGWAIKGDRVPTLNFADYPKFHKCECEFVVKATGIMLTLPKQRVPWHPKAEVETPIVEQEAPHNVEVLLGVLSDYYHNTPALEMDVGLVGLLHLPLADVMRKYRP